MRLMKLNLETIKVTSSKARRILFTTLAGELNFKNSSVFLIQQIQNGAESISARNLVAKNIGEAAGLAKVEVLGSGEKEVGHLNEADLTVNALLIGESS